MVSTTPDDTTFNPADGIDGGAGTDTFRLRLIDEASGNTASPVSSAGRTVDNVENLDIRTIHADGSTAATAENDAASVSLADFTNLENVTISGLRSDADPDITNADDGLTLNELEASDNLTIAASDSDHDIELNFDGSPTEADVTVEGAVFSDLVVNGDIETFNVTSGGDDSSSFGLDTAGSALSTLNVSGEQNVSLSVTSGSFDSNADPKTVDGSGLGDNTLTLTTAIDSAFNVTGGSGVGDAINANITGGDVEDDFTSEGVETIVVTGASGQSFNVENAAGLAAIGSTTAGNVTFEEAPDNVTVALLGDGDAGDDFGTDDTAGDGELGIPNIGDVTVEIAGTSVNSKADAVTVEVNNRGTDTGTESQDGADVTDEVAITTGGINVDDVTDVTLNAADGDVHIQGGISVRGMETLTITGTEDVLLGGDTLLAGTVPPFETASVIGGTNASGSLEIVDVSGVQGRFLGELPGNLENDMVFEGAEGADILSIGDQSGSNGVTLTINTGTGDDQVFMGQVGDAGGSDDDTLELFLGDGDDTLFLDDGSDTLDPDTSDVIDFGDGSEDLLNVSAAVDIKEAEVSGLEVIELDGGNQLDIDGGSFDEASLAIRSFGSDSVVFHLNGSDNLDASSFDLTGIGSTNGDITFVSGSDNNDITLTSSGNDVIRFNATGDGTDSINDFTLGTGNDQIEVEADVATTSTIVQTGGAADQATDSIGNGDVVVHDGAGAVINTNGGALAAINAAFAVGGDEFSADAEALFVFRDDTDGDGTADQVSLYHTEETDSAMGTANEANLLATLDDFDPTATVGTSFDADNFELI